MITNFPEKENENMGGCLSFEFVPCDEVITDAETDEATMLITEETVTTGGFYTGFAEKDSLEFIEQKASGVPGDSYKVSFSGRVNTTTADFLALLNEMSKHRFIIKCTDNNAMIREAGLKDNGLTFSFSGGTGKTPSNANGFDFIFSGEFAKPSPFLSLLPVS